MNALLVRLSDDPRAGLSAGLNDAGQALSNMKLLATLPKTGRILRPAQPGRAAAEEKGFGQALG